ncbi:hypothetical protein ED312_06330 [Sinomicrobium pectinilyticum]|uniref:DUF4177 domain-containing protein n=1 Tax=Sinomicrobium pectinilyticum TaxID=1084421 RepID=A0A3N0ESN6_SINP1|nr:hypothetical protein [Sinomicrobium pectinilyticum]RNL90782.1 hypothetical protein ED312_06330 [Sinomicrobium pectinilyticum]
MRRKVKWGLVANEHRVKPLYNTVTFYKIKKMKSYTIITMSTMWSTQKLKNDVERFINEKSSQGYHIVTVSFGLNIWWMPTAFITLSK